MPFLILGLGLVLMLAMKGGGASASALPAKKDERGELDIADSEFTSPEDGDGGQGRSDAYDSADAPGGNAIAPGGNAIAPGSDAIAPGGSSIAPQGIVSPRETGIPSSASEAALMDAQRAGVRQNQAAESVATAAQERGEILNRAISTQQEGKAVVDSTHAQAVATAQQAQGASVLEQRANAAATQAAAGRVLAEKAAVQQTTAANAAMNAANVAAAQARSATNPAQAQSLAERAKSLAAVAAQHKAAADAAANAAAQKSKQEAAARETAAKARQAARDKATKARQLVETEQRQAAALKAKQIADRNELIRKSNEVKAAAKAAAVERQKKQAALAKAENLRKIEAAKAIAKSRQELEIQRKKTAAAELQRKKIETAQARAKTATEKTRLENEKRKATIAAQAEKRLLAKKQAEAVAALKIEKQKQNVIKREIIKQAFTNAVERCVAFNPKAPRKNCINSVAKLFKSKGVPLTANLGTYETKTVEQVHAIVDPIPLSITPPKIAPRPPVKPKASTKPSKAPTELDVNPVNYELYTRAIKGITEYLDASIAKYPGIKTNLARKGITQTAQLLSTFFLPKLLEGISQAENVLVPGPNDKMVKRFYQRSENDRVMIALVSPPEIFRRKLLNALIVAEASIDNFGNPAFSQKWGSRDKSVAFSRGPAVSYLFKQFNTPAAPAAPAVSGMGGWISLGGWNS